MAVWASGAPEAEADTEGHGVSGGEGDSELDKGCLVRASLDIQPGGHGEGFGEGHSFSRSGIFAEGCLASLCAERVGKWQQQAGVT